eukprot:5922-Heterococcus_DN1.PRE.1
MDKMHFCLCKRARQSVLSRAVHVQLQEVKAPAAKLQASSSTDSTNSSCCKSKLSVHAQFRGISITSHQLHPEI